MSDLWYRIDEQGRLILPAVSGSIEQKLILPPASRGRFFEEADGIRLERPIDQLAKIYVEVTNRCNLTCRGCMRHGWDEEFGFMADTIFGNVIAGLEGLAFRPTVFFGGFGEPLFHEKIVDMVSQAKAAGARVELISNGILLSEDLAWRLIAAGLDFLWVSLDGASPESYADVRMGDHLPQILDNLHRLHRNRILGTGRPRGPELGISFVAMKRNINDLPRILDLGLRLGASRFLVSNVEAYSAAMEAENLYGRSLNNLPRLHRLDMPRMDIDTNNEAMLGSLARRFTIPGRVTPTDEDPFGACPFLLRGSASVRWDGRVSPCLPLLHAHTVYLNGRPRFWPEYHVGSVAERKLIAIWNDPEYTRFRGRLRDFNFAPCTLCNSCDLADLNGEDCFGNAHPACGGCLWAQGFIQCP